MRRLDDRGSMPLALLVVTIGMGLSATLAAMVITQVQTGDFDARRVQALHAAQAGLDVGLAAVRGAVDSTGVGDTALLPCGPLEGTLGDGTTPSYRVTINYYGKDPQGKPWTTDSLGNPVPPADGGIDCAHARVKDPGPAFVMFDSVGSAAKGATAERELRGTYVVHTDNTNISGGLVHVSGTSKDLCFDAGSAEPGAGAPLTVQLCNAGGTSQTWAYNENLQFVLVASQTPARPFGMCLDAGGYPRADYTKVTIPVLLQPCQSETPALYRQMWSFNDSAQLVGSNVGGTNTDGYCFNLQQADTAGSAVILTKTCNAFAADANVGAGQAASQKPGKYVGQLINYNQFGRCLDDTGQKQNAPFMIAWPCKQNPNPALVLWNQRYVLPALPSVADPTVDRTDANHVTGTIVMTWPNPGAPTATPPVPASNDAYCLSSPLSATLYQYVTTKPCDGSNAQQWTIYGHTEHYATSYTIVDSTGLYCLQPRDPTTTTPDLYQTVNLISKIYVGRCSGSTLQKWNADKNVVDAMALKDVTETPKKTD
ncbi:ricin-type beta-trefoil lectin domain protein [Actinoplanes sp. NPDC051411]|uniref:ricin-type beta-trefoil lectin domain protein n=1 Tax=Actinoplanes sp. NPDC051411 TaxID=3155522 RepID=UPI00344015CD